MHQSALSQILQVSLLLLFCGCSADNFKRRSHIEIDKDLAPVEGDMMPEWHKYVFDIRIVSQNNKLMPQKNLFNVVKHEEESLHELVHASSLGRSSMDGSGLSVSAITGLWEEPTMKRPRGAVLLRMYISMEFDDIEGELSTDSYKLTAQYVCYKWATSIGRISVASLLAEILKNEDNNWTKTLPLNIPLWAFSMWDLKTNQWEKSSPVEAEVNFAPYRVGRRLVIPVEIVFDKPDFESNCL